MFRNFIPRVRAQEEEEELVDPQQTLREKCRETPHCKHLIERYEECNARVASKARTTENCTEEIMDMLHAIDHCVTPKLFPKLKACVCIGNFLCNPPSCRKRALELIGVHLN